MVEENGDLWYRKVGFFNNPFSIKPAPFDFRIIGQEELLDELNYKIPAGTISFIEGPLGSGKSTMIKHLIHSFKGKGQVIFFSCNRIDGELNIEELLINKYGFWGKMFKMHPKDMILFLDEAQELTSENTERIKYFFDSGNIKSVVFAGTDYDEVKLHESIKERIGGDGVLKVKSLTGDDAVSLVKNRIGSMNLLGGDDNIKKLFELANENPRRFLQLCDRASRYVIENNDSEFKEEFFSKVFENEMENLKKKSKEGEEEEEVKKEEEEVKKEEVKKEEKKKIIKKKTSKKKEVKKEEKSEKKKEKEVKADEGDPDENLYDEEEV